MDGIEAVKRIHETIYIPIIFITGYPDPEIINRAKATNPHGFLNKPIQINELITLLEKF